MYRIYITEAMNTKKYFYEVIGQDADGEIDYIKKCLTFTEAKKVADRIWKQLDNNPNHKYGIIGIEKNLYKKDKWNNWEFADRLKPYCKLKDGSWV